MDRVEETVPVVGDQLAPSETLRVLSRLIFVLTCLIGFARAGEITLRVELPTQIVLPKPPVATVSGTTYQTSLSLRLVIENGSEAALQITTLDGTGGPKLLFPALVSRLFGPDGKEVLGGYVAADNFTASAARKDIVLAPGRSISLPYYSSEPFAQISVAGTYTLKVSARFQDEAGASHVCEAAPVTFAVAFEK
jgi:hypothetical protein